MADAPIKILCIEDEVETAGLFAEELTERGFEVAVVHDGRAGVAAVLRLMPDLVLCDISMTPMSGFEVLEELAAIAPRFAALPFVFLTALTDRENELRGRRLGADDYVAKPVDFDVLYEIIQKRLSGVPRVKVLPDASPLHDREIEVLTWAARGKTSLEIGKILGLSKRTVDFHMDNAREKLGVATRIQAAVKAASDGLIEP